MTTAPDALDASVNSDRPVLGTIEYGGQSFDIVRKPSTLLLAELARTDSGNPEAISVLADFFDLTLGDGYGRFKRAVYTSEQDDTEPLLDLVGQVIEKTLGRPTA